MQQQSKQLRYYYRHRKDRLEYQRRYYNQQKTANNNQQNNNENTIANNEKSHMCKLICSDAPIDTKKAQNKPILSVFDLVCAVLDYRKTGKEDTLLYCAKTTLEGKKKRRIRVDPQHTQIMEIMGYCRRTDFMDLEVYAKDIKKRKLKRILQSLVTKKWLVRQGRGNYAVYSLNPFLEFLLKKDVQFWCLLDFASFKIDFFDLLNLPLVNFVKAKKLAKKIDIDYIETRIGTITSFFAGFVQIEFIMQNGKRFINYLPCNLHAQPLLKWQYTQSGKYRTTNYHGMRHYCLPISWKLFDIKECKYFKKFDQQLGKTVYIHFDNSISLLCNEDKVISFIFVDYWKKALEKWQGYTYLEFREFDTLKKLFNARFVKGKRREELIAELGLKLKRITGRPKSK
ncbi:MAG: hypothetical protein NUK63_00070 [Candidatus Bathyarchaeum tardum]|nr:MAG: hypothetical protein NUK63_00070 [Candidatus Bathyarchaeum tardum]